MLLLHGGGCIGSRRSRSLPLLLAIAGLVRCHGFVQLPRVDHNYGSAVAGAAASSCLRRGIPLKTSTTTKLGAVSKPSQDATRRVLVTPPRNSLLSRIQSRENQGKESKPSDNEAPKANQDAGPNWVFLYPQACTCMLQTNNHNGTTMGASVRSAGIYDIPPDSCQGGYYGHAHLDPETVLKEGLESRGDDWDLLNHVLQKGNSAYRGTTKQIVYPEDGVGAASFAGEDGYVYEITCVPSWDVNRHLQGRIESDEWLTALGAQRYGSNLVVGEHEFCVPSFVPPSHIKRYGRVVESRASGTLFVPRTAWVENPRWNPAFCKYSVSDYSCEVLKVLLRELDADGNGVVDRDEFAAALESSPVLQAAATDLALDAATIFSQFDADASGTLSADELRNFLMQPEASCGKPQPVASERADGNMVCLLLTKGILPHGSNPRSSGKIALRQLRSRAQTTATTTKPISTQGRSISGLRLSQTPSSDYNEETNYSPTTIVDATLVGDCVVRMNREDFSWKLYPIRDIVTNCRTTLSEREETVWTEGTEASEALGCALSAEFTGVEPRVSLECLPSGDAFDLHAVGTASDDDEKSLLRLLQILQAQWALGLRHTKPSDSSSTTGEDGRRISVSNLRSREGLSALLREAGLVEGDPNAMEWVEMMTGSSQIVGRLPRPLVHKFNVLHRGIGAFVTRDRPIDLSALSPELVPDLYVHRRASDKRIFPSLYDMFVGGVSLAGEDAEVTAQREIAEELGLSQALSTSLVALSRGHPILTCLVCTAYNRCLVDLFQYAVDSSRETITWQEEEVAWGEFVDYRTILASADLSMQRAAEAKTWPGSYPPIQSELRGVLPEGDTSKMEDTDGNWKTWDYVPDGLLVWKAWLEMVETERKKHQQASQSPTLSFEVEFDVADGETECVVVELSSMADIVPWSKELATRFDADINDIQTMLKNMWSAATFVPTYEGPSWAIETTKDSAECTIELPSGLVLELRPSTIGEDAGLGLFVRKASADVSDVLQTQGSAFCGYGPCDQITDSMEGLSRYQRQRSFEFHLSDGMESYVWYKGNLLTAGDVIQSTGATAVKSHLLLETPEEGDGASSPRLSLVHDPKSKPCYLVPPAERPDPKSLSIQTIGHMCNDLAGGIRGQTDEEYNALSESKNLLVLVPRVSVNDDGVLHPIGMPILTLSKSVYVGSAVDSMEVGLRYGESYWRNEFL